ncbi:MAG TPA: GxxExxY protein, partial [Acetobacteraceae bacterium]
MIVEQEVTVEVKSVDRLLPVHEAQLLTYLRDLCESERVVIRHGLVGGVHIVAIRKLGQLSLADGLAGRSGGREQVL